MRMKEMFSGFKAALAAALLAVVMIGCGGGGGGGDSSSGDSGTTTTATLSGTAAKGAAFASVTVAIKDKNGSTKQGTTGTDGKYSIDTTGMTAPFLLKVSDGTTTYYSVSTATGTATANIHQFTDLIIRNWYKVKGSDIDTDFSASGALSQVPTATEIDTIEAVVVSIISNWLSTVGLDTATFNLITSSFNADGTGFDQVLDNNTVTIDESGNVTVTAIDPTTSTSSTIASMTITTDVTGETHASGTYTWDSTTGVITWNYTSSNFVCDGPEVGDGTETGVTITSTTMTWAVEGDMTWSRTSGTAGDIVGTWTASDSTTGNSWTNTFNADGTVSVVGSIVSCGSGSNGSNGLKAEAQHWSSGYLVSLRYSDPNKTATSVTVTGPGITGNNSPTGTGVSQFDGTYTGTWSRLCPTCGTPPPDNQSNSGTFTITVANGVFTNIYFSPPVSGAGGLSFVSGTVSSSGAITTVTGTSLSQCSLSVSTFTGQITTSSGGADMTMTYTRTADGQCMAESGTMTATRTSVALTYNTGMGSWGSGTPESLISFGTTYPTGLPFTYTFTITDATGTWTADSIVSCFQEQFVTNISPTGTVSGTPTFSWTGISDSSPVYGVELTDSSGSQMIWNNYNISGTSIAYSGPALTSGTAYTYVVSVQSSSACSNGGSDVAGSFTYQ